MFQVNLLFQLPLTNGAIVEQVVHPSFRALPMGGRDEREYTDCSSFANKKFLRANYILFKTLKRRGHIIENHRRLGLSGRLQLGSFSG